MKRHFLIPVVLVLSFCLFQSAEAQSNFLLTKPVKNQQSLQSTKNKPHFIFPNTFRVVRNKKTNDWLVPDRSHVVFLKNKVPQSLYHDALTQNQTNLNAGSMDPGIFYAPNEVTEPAAIILKPLKDVDSEMVIYPGLLKGHR